MREAAGTYIVSSLWESVRFVWIVLFGITITDIGLGFSRFQINFYNANSWMCLEWCTLRIYGDNEEIVCNSLWHSYKWFKFYKKRRDTAMSLENGDWSYKRIGKLNRIDQYT